MNNVQKVENGEYETGTEYRILYNGIKYKGILVFIGKNFVLIVNSYFICLSNMYIICIITIMY